MHPLPQCVLTSYQLVFMCLLFRRKTEKCQASKLSILLGPLTNKKTLKLTIYTTHINPTSKPPRNFHQSSVPDLSKLSTGLLSQEGVVGNGSGSCD